MSTSNRRAGSFSFKGALDRPGAVSPIVAAAIFSHQFNTTGGATMHAHTNEVARPGSPGYVVGGHPGLGGDRIPTAYIHDPQHAQRLDTVLEQRNRVRSQSASPHTSMGYWQDRASGSPTVEADATSIFRDRRVAKVVGRRRGEKSVWDLGAMNDLRLDGKR